MADGVRISGTFVEKFYFAQLIKQIEEFKSWIRDIFSDEIDRVCLKLNLPSLNDG